MRKAIYIITLLGLIGYVIFGYVESEALADQKKKNVIVVSYIMGKELKLIETYHTVSGVLCFSLAPIGSGQNPSISCIGPAHLNATSRRNIEKLSEGSGGLQSID